MESQKVFSQIFFAYSGGNHTIEGKQFLKIFKDNNLLNGGLTGNEVDIIFAKVKTKSKKRIVEEEMIEGLRMAAEIKSMPLEKLVSRISLSGPQFKGTIPKQESLHDDKSKYTGIYGRGGPSIVDHRTGMVSDLSQLANRKEANVRGVNKDMLPL